jgi:hypothetical protein
VSVVTLNVVMVSVIMLNVILLSVVMLNVILLSVVMLNVILPNVIMLNVVVLSVVAPLFECVFFVCQPISFAVFFDQPKQEKSATPLPHHPH